MINLKLMTAKSFEQFKQDTLNFAEDLAKAEVISLSEAEANTKEQFDKLAPEGQQTENNYFFDVIDSKSNEIIGYAWLNKAQRFHRQVLSIYDIKINRNYRGLGLGKELMALIEEEAKKLECSRIRLHVFEHNIVAKKLYQSMGFQITSLQMKKELY